MGDTESHLYLLLCVLTTTSERRCGGELLSHNHVTIQREGPKPMLLPNQCSYA